LHPGWRTSRTPYLAEVIAYLSTGSRSIRVVLMTGAQLGRIAAPRSRDAFNPEFIGNSRKRSNAGVPLIAEVFPETPAAPANAGDLTDRLDAHDVFRHLVAELTLDAQPQGCAMCDW
jgi:hypothetical protein